MNLLPLLLDAVRGALILGVALAALPLARRAPATIRRALLLAALLSALVAPLVTRAFAATSAAGVVALPFFVREIQIDPAVEPNEYPPVVVSSTADRASGERAARAARRAPVVAWSTLVFPGVGARCRGRRGAHRARAPPCASARGSRPARRGVGF